MRLKTQYRKKMVWLVLLFLLGGHLGHAESVTVAVSANFLIAFYDLKNSFELNGSHEVVLVTGSTGQLYAQIINGAPFDILLSADQKTATLLVESGFADPDSQFTYARGQLVLWGNNLNVRASAMLKELKEGHFRYLAIANPRIAPYGLAARQTLTALGIWPQLQERIVLAENTNQAFAWAQTGNADLGLVALSQALGYKAHRNFIVIPPVLYDPILQDAILLMRGVSNPAAVSFYNYLRSGNASDIIEQHGYLKD